MNYSKIKILQNQKNLSDRKFAKSIGLSGPGYKTMLEKQTCTVETIETICKVYKLSLAHFFDEATNLFIELDAKNVDCSDCKIKDALIEDLRLEKQEQKAEIAKLNREIGRSQPGERAQAG